MGLRGACEKSKSFRRSPRIETFSRTSGRGSGRPSVLGSMRDPCQEVILDELHVGVEAERLMVDVALARKWADDQSGNAQAIAVVIHRRRGHVIVETAPIVPGQKDRGALPVRALHDGIDQAGHIRLARADERCRVLAVDAIRADPRDSRQRAALSRGIETRDVLDVAAIPRLASPCRTAAMDSRCRASWH